jgi:hypothetical protein
MEVHLLVYSVGHRVAIQVMLEPVRSYVSDATCGSNGKCVWEKPPCGFCTTLGKHARTISLRHVVFVVDLDAEQARRGGVLLEAYAVLARRFGPGYRFKCQSQL